MNPNGYYSQGNEEKEILEYFGDRKGRFLDIGAFDGRDLSNTHRLALNGWEGFCIEASPQVYPALANLYKDNDKIVTINCAIGEKDGELDFYDNPGALGTASKLHMDRWKGYDSRFDLIKVPCLCWSSFFELFPYEYNFVSIDTEGLDWLILKQMDLRAMNTELICVEYTYNITDIQKYLQDNKYLTLFINGENIIARKL